MINVNHRGIATAGLLALAALGCGTSNEAGAPSGKAVEASEGTAAKGGRAERPAPFTVAVAGVDQLDVVAPNETWAKQGLGAKAPEGYVFACVRFTATNTADKPERLGDVTLIPAGGEPLKVDVAATSKYAPPDWKADGALDDVAPGVASPRALCFEVARTATTGMRLAIAEKGWGKNLGWRLETPL